VFSTYLGDPTTLGSSSGQHIAVDASGNAYVTGSAGSGFPTTLGSFQTVFSGAVDAFVSKLNTAGSALVYSTYLGGSGNDNGYGVAVDGVGNAYVTGSTDSSGFPTTADAIQPANGGGLDVFVSQLNPTGSALLSSTYFGGNGDDAGFAIALDTSGDAFFTGQTASSNLPAAPGAFQTAFGGGPFDGFVTKLSLGIGPPTNKDQCKNGGWKIFSIPEKFENQGECVRFVETGK
jgi:hypothetical protein